MRVGTIKEIWRYPVKSMGGERLEAADVPVPFRGAAIALVTAGLMSMAFVGFAGLFRI